MNLLILILIILFCYILANRIFSSGTIIVGTINKNTCYFRKGLRSKKIKTFHSDDFRNRGYDFKKSSWIALRKFLISFLFLKKSYLFSSNPSYLQKKIKLLLLFLGIRVLDFREEKEKNIEWVKNLNEEEIREFIPNYFLTLADFRSLTYVRTSKKKAVMLRELERYEDGRFIPSLKRFDFVNLEKLIPGE